MPKKISGRVTETSELNCVWRLLGILYSNPKLITNGRHVIDYSRSVDQVTSFDEQCRKIQNAGMGRAQKGAMKDRDKAGRRSTSSHPLAALLEAVSAEDHALEEEYSPCDSYHSFGKFESTDEATMQQVSVNSNKDRFADLLPEPDSLLPRESKSFRSYRMDRETIKSVLDAKLAEYQRENVRANCGKQGSKQKEKMNKIPVQEPAGDVICNCSSVQYHRKLSRLILDTKPVSFTFWETKKKLKDAFSIVGKGENRLSMDGNMGAVDRADVKHCKNREVESKRYTSIDGKKPEVDVILEAKRRLSERMRRVNEAEAVRDKKSRTLRRILASPEHDFFPRRESQYCFGSARSSFSSYNTCGSPIRQDTMLTSPIPCPEGDCQTGISRIVEANGIPETSSENKINNVITTLDTDALHKDDGSISHSLPDSLMDEALTSATEDFQSTPSSIYQLEIVENLKYQEEHQSPVSVLEPFFAEDVNSPQNLTLQTDRQRLQPRRLDFDEQSISMSSCLGEQDHISEYIHSILQASQLDWDQLSKIEPFPEELLQATLFDEVEFMLPNCCFDPKLLFDHINEILTDIHQSRFRPCPYPAAAKENILSAPLGEFVVDEVMSQADFYLLPRTEKRTLDQLVSRDVKNSRWWLDVAVDTEQIAADVSEMLIEECIEELVFDPVI